MLPAFVSITSSSLVSHPISSFAVFPSYSRPAPFRLTPPSNLLTYHSPLRYLLTSPHVAWVSYLGLPAHPSHQLALATLRPGAFGGVLNFGVKGDAAQASKVVDLLKLASNLANVGASALP